jgi:hypothetical protein
MPLVVFSTNRKKPLTEIYLPPLGELKGARADYNGHGEVTGVS